jgi:hypothetical protein
MPLSEGARTGHRCWQSREEEGGLMAEGPDRMTLIMELGAMAKQAEKRGDKPSAVTLRATVELLIADKAIVDRPMSDLPATRARGRQGYVYYAGAGDAVKIGHSRNPWARLRELRIAQPHIRLLGVEQGDRGLETRRHEQFAASRIKGEWFRRSPELDGLIATVADSSSDGDDGSNDVATTIATETPFSPTPPFPSITTTAQSSPRGRDAVRESLIAERLTSDAGRAALARLLDMVAARGTVPDAVIGEISACVEGARGPQHRPTGAQLDVALSDYVSNGFSNGGMWNAQHFRGCIRRAVAGESNPPGKFAARAGSPQAYAYTPSDEEPKWQSAPLKRA